MNQSPDGSLASVSRRQFLCNTSCGFGGLAWAALAQAQAQARPSAVHSTVPRGCHFTPRAKRVIFLFMQGGVSQVDSFDYKPLLQKEDGQQVAFDDARKRANTGSGESTQRIMGSPWRFARHGQSGRWVSELFPKMAQHVDQLCFVHGMHTEGVAHGPATLFLHCGATNLVRPSMGAWIAYGLGSETEDLPAFATISPSAGNGGTRNYGAAFLPAQFQGTPIGRAGEPLARVRVPNLSNEHLSPDAQRRQLDHLQRLNRAQQLQHAHESDVEAAISSYELAWKMQRALPSVMTLSDESPETLEMYGIGKKPTDDFGRQCLLARRLCEQGVRYIQVTYGDNTANPAWDQHSNLPKHAEHALAVDQPIAALLTDLDRRGLLEDTIVWWGGEFGRTPYAERGGTGRDHNPGGFTMWLAGGGFRPGHAHGETDEFGHRAVQGKVHLHDLHATILHQLGLDHEQLTFRYAGRDFRLTDVFGSVVREIV